MTAEERARGVFAEAKAENYSKEGLRHLVGIAIRDAENAAYDRAAEIGILHARMAKTTQASGAREEDILGGAWGAAEQITRRIRDLKSKETRP